LIIIDQALARYVYVRELLLKCQRFPLDYFSCWTYKVALGLVPIQLYRRMLAGTQLAEEAGRGFDKVLQADRGVFPSSLPVNLSSQIPL
jgi:hypothetical protein